MGQQQLLLLALSAVIVGLSIVVGINLFSSGAGQANQDAVTQDALTIATRAQAWFRKPTQFGGGGRNFTPITLADIRFPGTNDNGTYTITGTGTGPTANVVVVGTGNEDLNGDGALLSVTITASPDSITATAIKQ